MSFIEDENELGYTIRCDLLQDGQELPCKDDPDMKVKKEGTSVVLVKKAYDKNCFSK